MEHIYYMVKHRKDSYSLEGVFGNPQIALEAINDSYRRAKERGYDNRMEPWAVYRVHIHKDFDKDGVYLGSSRTEKLWNLVKFSEINDQFILDI